MNNARRNLGYVAGLLGLLILTLAFRALGPSDIYDNDQAGPISHIVDVAVNGQWLMQRDPAGKLATKPPMYPWLGAIAVHATGQTDEWTFKLPLVVAFIVCAAVVFDLSRRTVGIEAASVAAGFWIANYHTFKLMYTARTDMLVTMWIAIALWAVQRQREIWNPNTTIQPAVTPVTPPPPTPKRHPLPLIALFGMAIGAGLLTKGPPALIPLVWLVGVIAYDRAWRRCRPVWQVAGVALAVGLALAWLLPAVSAYPQWNDNINKEVFERVSGQGSGAGRHTPMLAIPGYFMGRFAPWSILFAVAAIMWRKWNDKDHPVPLWPVVWVAMILIIFAIPKGKRADYLLPAYLGASILAAEFVSRAAARTGWHRDLVHVVLGAVGIGGIAMAVTAWCVDWPGQPGATGLTTHHMAPLIVLCSVAALGFGASTLGFMHRRRYLAAALLSCLTVVGQLGLYQAIWSRAAKTQAGEMIRDFVDTARRHSQEHQIPIGFEGTAGIPVQALLGRNEPEPYQPSAAVPGKVLLIYGLKNRQELPPALGDQASIIARTPRLKDAKTTLLLVETRDAQ